MDCPSPQISPIKPSPSSTVVAVPPPNNQSIFTYIWKTLTDVFMAPYGGNPVSSSASNSRESSKEEEPPKEDKPKND
uniref:Uncharacterized protein n=1 Tax=Panagrolaimus davidi TaxID=227884 RepID=A0A914P037_9BILA